MHFASLGDATGVSFTTWRVIPSCGKGGIFAAALACSRTGFHFVRVCFYFVLFYPAISLVPISLIGDENGNGIDLEREREKGIL